MDLSRMISVVIPTLNAGASLDATLQPLVPGVMSGLVKEVIVADGGSTDDTLALAESAGCDVVNGQTPRAKLLRAGAGVAKGKWLLFLYPGTVLGASWVEEAAAHLNAPQARKRAGAFRLKLDDKSQAARRAEYWVGLRAKVAKLPFGDQGLLISRFLYDGVGGYPDMAMMEDVEIVRRIGRDRLVLLETEAKVNADAYRRGGYAKSAWRNFLLMTRYLMGGDPVELAKAE